VEEEDSFGGQEVLNGRDQSGEVRKPAPSIKFDDNSSIVEVSDQPWKSVILAVDDTEPGRTGGRDSSSPIEGEAYTACEELLADLRPLPLHEEANPDRTIGVIKSRGQEAVLPIEDDGDVAGRTRATLGHDTPIEEPGVTFADCSFRSRVDPQSDPGRP